MYAIRSYYAKTYVKKATNTEQRKKSRSLRFSFNVMFNSLRISLIFQDYKLIPTKTVFENVALVLEAMGKKRGLIRKKVRSVLRTVGMEERHYSLPPSLSGGEQQRIAIARRITSYNVCYTKLLRKNISNKIDKMTN